MHESIFPFFSLPSSLVLSSCLIPDTTIHFHPSIRYALENHALCPLGMIHLDDAAITQINSYKQLEQKQHITPTSTSLTCPSTQHGKHASDIDSASSASLSSPSASSSPISSDLPSLHAGEALVLPDVGGCMLNQFISFVSSPSSTQIVRQQNQYQQQRQHTSTMTLSRLLHLSICVSEQLGHLHSLGILLQSVRPSSIQYNENMNMCQFLDFTQSSLMRQETKRWGIASGNIDVPKQQWPYVR